MAEVVHVVGLKVLPQGWRNEILEMACGAQVHRRVLDESPRLYISPFKLIWEGQAALSKVTCEACKAALAQEALERAR